MYSDSINSGDGHNSRSSSYRKRQASPDGNSTRKSPYNSSIHSHGKFNHRHSYGSSGSSYQNSSPRGYSKRPRYDGGHGDSSGSHPNKKPVPSLEENLISLIFLVGDTTSSTNNNLEELANIICKEYENFKDSLLSNLIECISEMSWKTSIYCTLVGLINLKKTNITIELLNKINAKLVYYLENSYWNQIILLLRFIGDLVNIFIINPIYWLKFIEPFLSLCEDSSENLDRRYYFFYAILATLPWNRYYLNQNIPTELNQFFDRLGVIMKALQEQNQIHPQAQNMIYPTYNNFDHALDLFNKINSSREIPWNSQFLLLPYTSFESLLSEGESASDILAILPSIPSPSTSSLKVPYPNFRNGFRFYLSDNSLDDSDSDEFFPKENSIERWILFEIIRLVIVFFEQNHKKCIEFLFSLSFNKAVNLNRAIIETLVSCMMILPRPDYSSIYYELLVVDCLAANPSKVARSIGETFQQLFYSLPYLDSIQRFRFSEFMSYHLNNFSFKWNWETWAKSMMKASQGNLPDTTNSPVDGGSQRADIELSQGSSESLPLIKNFDLAAAFIEDLLMRLTRLSYYQKIKPLIPTYFQETWLDYPPGPNCKLQFSDLEIGNESGDLSLPSSSGSQDLVNALCQAIRKKEPGEKLLEILKDYHSSGSSANQEESMSETEIKSVALQVLLWFGAKSFSHASNIIERYKTIFEKYNQSPSERIESIVAIYQFWKYNSLLFSIVLDKLISVKVFDGLNLVQWLFLEENEETIQKSWAWSILYKLFNKAYLAYYSSSSSSALVVSSDGTSGSEVPASEPAFNSELQEKYVFFFNSLFSSLLKNCARYINKLSRAESEDFTTNNNNGHQGSELYSELQSEEIDQKIFNYSIVGYVKVIIMEFPKICDALLINNLNYEQSQCSSPKSRYWYLLEGFKQSILKM